MERRDDVWKSPALTRQFLDGVRGAIPLANEQIAVMLRVIAAARPNVESFLDLGCGDGILGRAVLGQYPNARGVFLDFSEPMLDAAKERTGAGHTYLVEDYGLAAWVESVREHAPFDVIVSGFSIHHQPDARKQEVYRELYALLKPGGVFLNLEHVSSASRWVESLFEDIMIDSMFAYHQDGGGQRTRQEIADEFYYRPDKDANILAPMDVQLGWLRVIGFLHVDCYLKIFELALFGGIKPE